MKHNIYLLIILSIATPCMAMLVRPANQLTSIVFLPNNRVVVGGKDGCNIFNSHSKQLIKELTSHEVRSLAANKDIIAIVDSKKNQCRLTVFDTTTHKKEWSTATYTSHLALNPLHPTLITSLGYYVDTYDYKQQIDTHKSFFVYGLNNKSITCNPTDNTLFYTTGTGLCIAHPSKYEFDKKHQCFQLIPIQSINIHHNVFSVQDSILSPDGHTILFKYNGMWSKYAPYFVYDLNDEKEVAHYILDNKNYDAFAFHPTLTLLAALSDDNKVKFWDYTTHTLIATTHQLSPYIYPKNNDRFTQQLSFSPDGSQLAVALPNSWHIINIPGTLKHLALILYALRTHTLEEVVHTIMNIANLIKITPITMSTATEPDLSQATEHKYVQKWIEYKDPDASSSEEDFF